VVQAPYVHFACIASERKLQSLRKLSEYVDVMMQCEMIIIVVD
jgi:hypothetical protein